MANGNHEPQPEEQPKVVGVCPFYHEPCEVVRERLNAAGQECMGWTTIQGFTMTQLGVPVKTVRQECFINALLSLMGSLLARPVQMPKPPEILGRLDMMQRG